MKFQDLINSNLFTKYCRNLFDNLYGTEYLSKIVKRTSPYYDEEKSKLYESREWKNHLLYHSKEERERLKKKENQYKQRLKSYYADKKETVFKVLECLNININNYKNKNGTYGIPFFLEKLIEVICYDDSDKSSLISKMTCDENHKLSNYENLYFMTKTLQRIKNDLDGNKISVNAPNNETDAFLYSQANLPHNIDDFKNKANIALEENNYLLQTQKKITNIINELQTVSDMLYLPIIQTNNPLENLYIIFESRNPYAKNNQRNNIKITNITLGNTTQEIDGIFIPNNYNKKEALSKYDDYLEKIQQSVNDLKERIDKLSINIDCS